ALLPLLDESGLPILDTYGHQVAIVAPVQESFAWILLHLSFEERQQIVTVNPDLESLVAGLVSLLELLHNVRLAGGRQKRRQHVGVREDFVGYRARLDHARPPDRAGHAPSTFVVGVFFAAERRRSAVGPTHHLGAIIGRVHDDGVVADTEIVDFL